MRLSDSGELTAHARTEVPRAVTVAAILMLIGVVALADFVLVPNGPVSHLYYLPILLSAIKLGRRYAIAVAALAVVLAHLADPELSRFHYGEADIMELLLFVTVAIVASKLALDARDLRRLASTDDLTGLHNLRSFEALSRTLIERHRRTSISVAVLCLDVDRLKQLNDCYGHLTGADAVKRIGETIADSLPGDAHACRYGGDEFAIALPEASAQRTAALAAALQAAVTGMAPVLDGKQFPAGTLSISIGYASRTIDSRLAAAAIFTDLFRRADSAMYVNKRARSLGQRNVAGFDGTQGDRPPPISP